jgi:immune inhibitor A
MNSPEYLAGPTACAARYDVVKSIKKQMAENRVLSLGDFRLARRMGLISAPTVTSLGFNDGLIYPPDEPAATTRSRAAKVEGAPSRALSHSAPTGKMHALALLVDFSDSKGTTPASHFQKLLFDPLNANSMTTFYKELSFGRLDVSGEAIGYIRAPKPYSFYTAGQSGTGNNFPQNTPGLLVDALTEFCKTDNLQRFDQDGDGFVDGIFLIHAGGGAEAEPNPAKRPNMIWSHKWVLPSPFTNSGVKVFAYSTEPEDGRLGVFSHEFGHVLGLPDLYDTTYRSHGVGDWCLMGGGSWGGSGDRPVRMSCWCLSRLNWITPKVIGKGTTSHSLLPLENDASACRRVWKGGVKKGSEYFLLEHRAQAGRDLELPGQGLLIWHIDETQTDNTNPLAYRVALAQADGQRHLERLINQGDTADPYPGSKNIKSITDTTIPSTRSNQGAQTKIAITKISRAAGKASFSAKV